jgi:hypothetical protein
VPDSRSSALPSFAAPTLQGVALPQHVAPAPLPIAAVALPHIPAATLSFNPRQGRNWRHLILPRFIAAAAANPVGFEAAHALIATTHSRSLAYGPYNDTTARKGGFRSVVITTFLPQYFQTTYLGQRVPPTHTSKIQWHNARTQPEQDAIRLFIQQKVEDDLINTPVAAQVANLRQGGGLNTGVLLGPNQGSSSGSNMASNGGITVTPGTMNHSNTALGGGPTGPFSSHASGTNNRSHSMFSSGGSTMPPMTGRSTGANGMGNYMNGGVHCPSPETTGVAPYAGSNGTNNRMTGGLNTSVNRGPQVMNNLLTGVRYAQMNVQHQAMGRFFPMSLGFHQMHQTMHGGFKAPMNAGFNGNNQIGGDFGGKSSHGRHSLPMGPLNNVGINGMEDRKQWLSILSSTSTTQ